MVALSILPATQAAAFGKGAPKGSKLSPLEAAQQTYGITPDDLVVTDNTTRSAQALRKSTANPKVEELLAGLGSAGLVAADPEARLVEVPLARAGKDNPVVDLITYPLRKNGRVVGAAHHFWGPKGEVVFANFKRDDGSAELRAFENGKLERATYDRSGRVIDSTVPVGRAEVEARRVGCFGFCQAICGAGALTTFGACFTSCLASVFANVICTPLCAILLEVGCLFGCDEICDRCCR